MIRKKNLKKYSVFIYLIITIFFLIFLLNEYINFKLKNKNYLNYSPEIYSDILEFKRNDLIEKENLIKILFLSKYNITKKIPIKPGYFSFNKNYIFIFRRSFDFPKCFENSVLLKIKIKDKKIIYIYDLKKRKYIYNFKLDPQLIYFPENNNIYKIYNNINNFPKILIDSILIMEDKNFYFHKGFSFKSIIRAIIHNFKNKKIKEGGSTITQQLVKNLFFNSKKKIIRKFFEFILSIIIEFKYSKREILELYLNEVYFGTYKGKELRGFPIASIYYFNKLINELNVNEQITLVSMIKGPSLYNPYKKNNLLINRRNFILNKMKSHKLINNKFYNHLINLKILLYNKNIILLNKSFIKIILNDLKKDNINFLKCKKIFSNFSLLSQKNCNKSYYKILKKIREKKKDFDLESAILIINYKNGKIVSSIGGYDKEKELNRLYIRRNIGSIIKPIIYLCALENKEIEYQLNSILIDKPIYYKEKNQPLWAPKNCYGKFFGKVRLIDSLVDSLNLPVINLGISIGLDNIIDFIKKMINNKDLKINSFLSILLGSIPLNIIEISQMYQSLANNGNFIELKSVNKIIDINNNLIIINKYKKNTCSEKSSYLIKYCMKEIIERGTGKNFKKKKILIYLEKQEQQIII